MQGNFELNLTGIGTNPAIDETYTMLPPPRLRRYGKTSLDNKNALLTFTSNILSQASSVHCKKKSKNCKALFEEF